MWSLGRARRIGMNKEFWLYRKYDKHPERDCHIYDNPIRVIP
jgi:hypothetical protein